MSKLTVDAPKEVVDALSALEGFVGKVMAHEGPAQLLSEELGVVVGLLQEAKALPDEVKNQLDQCLDAGALYGRRMVYRVLGKSVVDPVVS